MGAVDLLNSGILASVSISLVPQSSESIVLQDYLSTIYRLEEIYGVAKTCMIASELDVTPATVSKMLLRLNKLGFVNYDKYRGATLTEKGREVAENIIRKHRICECFLRFALDFSISESHIYAHIMEHLPDTIIDRIFELSGKPRCCPHGNPIPGVEKTLMYREDHSLDEIAGPCRVRVVRILGELKRTLEFLEKSKIEVGTVLEIEGKDSKNIYARKVDCGCIIVIPRVYAFQIRVIKV